MNRTDVCLVGISFLAVVFSCSANAAGTIETRGDWSHCFYDDQPEKPKDCWQNGVWCDTPAETSKIDQLIEENNALESKLEELSSVVEVCCFTINSKLDALCSDDWCADELCSDVDMCCCGVCSAFDAFYSTVNSKTDTLVCGQKRTNLVFTAPDMNKTGQNPDTSFNNVYNGMNFSIQAWKMFQGSNPQQEISLLFGLPNNCDTSKPFEVSLYLLVQKNSGSSGDKGTIRISIDSKDTLQKLGPDFLMTVTTGDFAITEPLESKKLQTLIVKKEFYAPALLPGGLLVLVFDRVLPIVCADNESPVCTQDYSKEIFLESVVFSFYENECV